MQTPPKAALIGRTNVGKSSLFNKMIEEQKSLVSDIAGTTRDRFEADCIWRGHVIRVVDTGGLDVDPKMEIEKNVILQAEKAIEQADLVFFLVDLNVGPTVDDQAIAKKLMEAKKPVIVVGNKADSQEVRRKPMSEEWRSWPLKKPMAISAKQGTGVGDLLDEATNILTEIGKPPLDVSEVIPMRVCVIGEPNVGKSTLLNSILGEERFIAANIPHTTREPNDVMCERKDKQYLFIDTAGIRKQARRNKAGTHLEQIGVEKTLLLIEKAHVALFVIDATLGITSQDRHLAGVLAESGISIVIVANKWDLVQGKTPTSINTAEAQIRALLPQIKYAPMVFTSALNGKRVEDLFKHIDHVFASRFTQLSDDESHQFMSRAIMRHKPIRGKGVKHPKIQKFAQVGVNPPRFLLQVDLSRKDSLSVSYIRFLENLMREHYDFTGTPLRIRIQTGRKSHTTY